MACGPYDRLAALADGCVRPGGANLRLLEPEEIFWRMIRHAEFDVSKMSLSSYAVALARGDDRFVGLPVFLSRSFRHSSIYLAPVVEISDPAELAGARIGVPEYQMTAGVWTRGLLSDEFGVRAEDVTWVTGGLEEPGRPERQPLQLPTSIRVERLTERRYRRLSPKGS